MALRNRERSGERESLKIFVPRSTLDRSTAPPLTEERPSPYPLPEYREREEQPNAMILPLHLSTPPAFDLSSTHPPIRSRTQSP